jgi:hypothetical protein
MDADEHQAQKDAHGRRRAFTFSGTDRTGHRHRGGPGDVRTRPGLERWRRSLGEYLTGVEIYDETGTVVAAALDDVPLPPLDTKH